MEKKYNIELTEEELKSLYFQVEKDRAFYDEDEDMTSVLNKLEQIIYANGILNIVVNK